MNLCILHIYFKRLTNFGAVLNLQIESSCEGHGEISHDKKKEESRLLLAENFRKKGRSYTT